MDADDPLLALEHDHVHLSRLVAELRASIHGGGPLTDVAATLATLRDDLFEHFAREEEALFPYLLEAVPTLRADVARLESAHDRICGALSRLLSLAEKGASSRPQSLVAQLFDRFDADYVDHARNESEFLRTLAARLDETQRARVRAIMRDV